jgi:hypothetical protein
MTDIFPFLDENLSIEILRSYKSIDIEISDKIKLKILNNTKLSLDSKKISSLKNKINISDKVDLINLLQNSSSGISVRSLANCYLGIRNDLLQISRANFKNRKILVVKNDFFNDCIILPFEPMFYISLDKNVILNFYEI